MANTVRVKNLFIDVVVSLTDASTSVIINFTSAALSISGEKFSTINFTGVVFNTETLILTGDTFRFSKVVYFDDAEITSTAETFELVVSPRYPRSGFFYF